MKKITVEELKIAAADAADATADAWVAARAADVDIETKQIEMVRKVFIDMEVTE
jgi:hypothetical protein